MLTNSLRFQFQLIHAAFNITTNERINHKRYDYLKDGKGRFFNPFNKGMKHNLMEFFHLKKTLREDEVQLLGVDVVWFQDIYWYTVYIRINIQQIY